MGRLSSTTNHAGLIVNNVILGEPVELDNNPTTFEWDDSAFPNGTIDIDGQIVLTFDGE